MSPARLALSLTSAGVIVLVIAARLAGTAWVDVLSLVFLALPVAAWAAAFLLWQAHRTVPEAHNLGERAVVAVRDALVATVGAVLGLNRLAELHLAPDVTLALLSVALLLVTAYPLAWLIQWARGRWD